MCKRKTSAISGSEPLPQVHWIHNTDLTEFVYKLHMFAGDFLRERAFNLHSRSSRSSEVTEKAIFFHSLIIFA